MPSIQYPLIGVMDLDTPREVFQRGRHSGARNVLFRGDPGNTRAENYPGTRAVFTPPVNSQCLGGYYDSVKNRIFFFNYDPGGNSALYVFYTLTEATQIVTNDDAILDLDPNNPISSIYLLYGDVTQGDVLYWVNSQGKPSQINIDQALAGSYGALRPAYLDVIKAPAQRPPAVVYFDDTTATINNFRGKLQLMKFKTRLEYNNRDKSVWSAHSWLPLPVNTIDPDVDADPTKNNRIAIVIPTGPPNVKKIEIAACNCEGVIYGDFYSIDILDKSELGIPDDDLYIYYFLNDKSYLPIDVVESIQLQDKVPQEANTMILLNGNTPAYGGITEGYNLLSLGSSVAGASSESYRRTQSKSLIVASQSGNSVGVAGDNIHIIIVGAITAGDVFTIATTSQTVTYTASGGDDTAAVIAGLSASATGAGFTIVSSGTTDLVIQKAAEQLLQTVHPAVSDVLGINDTTLVYDWWSKDAWGITYYDAEGRTNGAIITTGFTVTSSGYSEVSGVPQIPVITITITSTPPIWAAYFHLVRSNNMSKQKILQWISDRTFKDNVQSTDGKFYAYISIESVNQYIKDNPSSSFLAYDFVPGDRIRFIKLYPNGGLTTPQIEIDKEFEVQGQVINPVINGAQYQGQFVKIYLPTTDAGFDFGIQFHVPYTSDVDYSNYYFELFRPAKQVAENLDTYFEHGERYAVIGAGTGTRYHQGQIQNQTAILPATFAFDQGDFYLRTRNINAAPELKFTLVEQDSIGAKDFIAMTLDQDYNAVGYVAKGPSVGHLSVLLWTSDNWLVNVTDGNAYTFTIRGSIVIQALNNGAFPFYLDLAATDPGGMASQIDLTPQTMGVAGKVYNFTVDTTFTIPATFTKLFLLFGSTDGDFRAKIVSGNLTFTDGSRTFSQLIIDPNFSDSFQSSVNSNGRPQVFDINAKQINDGQLMRFGLSYIIDTNINQTNRFYPDNNDVYDASYGDIIRFWQIERILRVFQYRKCGAVGVYARWIKQGDGSNQLITSDTIITKNNINYYVGDFGIGNQPMSLAGSGYANYFPDPVKGYLCRLSLDGVVPISDLYKVQTWTGNNLPAYLNQFPYQYGGYAKIVGAFRFNKDRSGDFICSAQDGLYGIGESLTFNEKDNAFRSHLDWTPDFMLCAENKLVSWFGGKMYIHDDTDAYGTFYGVHHDAEIEVVGREPEDVNKLYRSLSYASPYPQYGVNVPSWISPVTGDVETALGQQSNLVESDFAFQNAMKRADLRHDANSPGGVNNGDDLEGLWIKLRLRNSSSQLTWLSNLYINYEVSQRNF